MSLFGLVTLIIFVMYVFKFGLGKGLKFVIGKWLKSVIYGFIVSMAVRLLTGDAAMADLAYAITGVVVTLISFKTAAKDLR